MVALFMRNQFRQSFGFAVLLVLAVAAWAKPPSPSKSAWTPVDSDLATDPRLIDRTLPNGFRYLILPNAEPKEQVSIRLVVAVGSWHENDDELGLAHFVEHMAFRGTREYPAGTGTEVLQRVGIALGPDSTAFTSFDHTIYHLEVPTKSSTLDVALNVLREYAANITFAPELIEKERGVVLSERATRDTPDARASDFNLQLLWPKSREVRRKPIGSEAQIRTFTRDQFIAFYDAWYRPERMALIVVGNVDPETIERRISEVFGGLIARAPARAEPPDLITPDAAAPDIGIFRDPGNVGVWIGFEAPLRRPLTPDSHAGRVNNLRRALAFGMLYQRLRKRSSEEGSLFLSPIAGVTGALRRWELTTLGLSGRIGDWRAIAIQLEQQHRTALQFGFTAAELAEVRAQCAMQLDEGVRTAATRPSPILAQQLVSTLLLGSVFSTPTAVQQDLAPELEALTVQDCGDAFRTAWGSVAPMIVVIANASFEAKPDELRTVVKESREITVMPPAEMASRDFAYTSFGTPGKLTQEETLPDLDARLTEFENHVKFNFKSTPFEADVVEVRVRVGTGRLSLLKSQPGLDLLAESAVTGGGLGRHSEQELTEILAGHALRVNFQVRSDAFLFYGRCARRELDLLLRLLSAYLTDTGFRPEALRYARAHYGTIISRLLASPGGPISMNALREMFSDDSRFGVANYDEFSARDLGELRAWIEPQFQSGPVEVSIVGDVSWPEARTAMATTLGALPERKPVGATKAAIPVILTPASDRIRAYSISPTLGQTAVAWYWPVPDLANIHDDRRCRLLAAIVTERLRVKLREELGATYGARADFTRIDGFTNASCFSLYVELEPRKVSRGMALMNHELATLCEKGPTADEFERAKEPYVRAMANDLRTNAYWGDTVLSDAQQHPTRVTAARDRNGDVAAISRTEVTALARKYLSPKRAYQFATVKAEPPTGATP